MNSRTSGGQSIRDGQIGTSQRMRPAAWVGLTAHGLLGMLHLVTGLLATFWTVVVLWTVWTGLLAMAVKQRYRQPMLVAVAPMADLAVWLLAVLMDAAVTT